MAAKKKVTFSIDEDVLRAARVRAARDGRRDSDRAARCCSNSAPARSTASTGPHLTRVSRVARRAL